MPSRPRWPDAVLFGVASSMRTFAGVGTLALRGRVSGRPRTALIGAALGEIAWDKAPFATSRTDPPGLAGRIVAGAYGGQALAGPAGAVVGALGAGAGTYATFHARRLAVRATGIADPAFAVVEDIVAFTCAAVATRDL